MMETLFYLVAMHALTDFVLQDEWMYKFKHPDAIVPPNAGAWWWWMTAHGLVNGLGVALITGSAGLGLAETLAHMTIDTLKCTKRISANIDQVGHLTCKVLWSVLTV